MADLGKMAGTEFLRFVMNLPAIETSTHCLGIIVRIIDIFANKMTSEHDITMLVCGHSQNHLNEEKYGLRY